MKAYYLCIRLFAFLCLSTLTSQAIPLASAKVLVVEGKASYGVPKEENMPLTEGTILTQGDSIVTGNNSVVHLIFSNGAGLTIEEGSNLVFSELEQRAFWKSYPSEIPKEEYSRSKTILELKYGKIKGHVSSLREDSEFRINTILGDVEASKNLFFVELFYSPLMSEYVLNVQNINGLVNLYTKFSGYVKFGRKGVAKKSYDATSEITQIIRIPPNKILSIKSSSLDNAFKTADYPLPKTARSQLVFGLEAIEPFPADQEVIEVSPNGTLGPQADE